MTATARWVGAAAAMPALLAVAASGQTPTFRRLPKRGFSNENFERRFHVVNLEELNRFDDGAIIDAAALKGTPLADLPLRKILVRQLTGRKKESAPTEQSIQRMAAAAC